MFRKIKRVIFATMRKFDGFRERPLSISQTKQIAGRAGRFGLHSDSSVGEATTLQGTDLKHLKHAIAAKLPPVNEAVLRPSSDMVTRLAALLPRKTTFNDIMELIRTSMIVRAPYIPGEDDRTLEATMGIIRPVSQNLTMSDCMVLFKCPMSLRDPILLTATTNMAKAFAADAEVPLDSMFEDTPLMRSFRMVEKLQAMSREKGWSEAKRKKITAELADRGHIALSHLESLHKTITCYLWMSNRLPPVFPGMLDAQEMKQNVESAIDFYLTLVVTSGDRVLRVHNRKEAGAQQMSLSDAMDIGDGVDLSQPPPEPVTHPARVSST